MHLSFFLFFIYISFLLGGRGQADPISFAVQNIPGYGWLATFIAIGALLGLTSVMLVSLLGQPRIFYAMAKDGLFPEVATKVHPRFKTPYITTGITGAVCAVFAGKYGEVVRWEM